jgi:hypothetical protein
MHMYKKISNKWLVALLLAAVGAITVGCGGKQQSARNDQTQVNPVSETQPKFEPLPQTAPVTLSARFAPSIGDCGPKYANGLRGACINNRPCRGIGIYDSAGKAVCACYAREGGCSESERCDAIKKSCVPEKEPGFGRAPED